ncbi:hypothetical protein [Oceanobacter mangrovi]|uniref:hypothetical protein n=1 Tax=Oceanobacter mangrovi TaxID=2862510 RepID=UPI001C8CFD3B|nr:hypothetical protein [Oceanobacter mangrovi]
MKQFEQFVWHDLPVQEITFSAIGLKLVVTPYNENAEEYDKYCLELEGNFVYSLQGSFTSDSLEQLEVATLNYDLLENGTISGKLGLLPGDDGYWTISFQSAMWKLYQVT